MTNMTCKLEKEGNVRKRKNNIKQNIWKEWKENKETKRMGKEELEIGQTFLS